MNDQNPLEQLENIDDENLAKLMEFVEEMGSVEDAKAALDVLNKLGEAA